jgi:hypothetical protein
MGKVQYVQGDVYLVAGAIPGHAAATRSKTLAEGEATDHAHVAEGDVEIFELDGTLYLRVGESGAEIMHQEHKTLKVPEGEYEVGIVQEYDYFKEEARRVKD